MPMPFVAAFGCGKTTVLSLQLCRQLALCQKQDAHERKDGPYGPGERLTGHLSAPQRFQERAPKRTQASADIGTEVRAQHAAVALCQNLKVSSGLGRLDQTKRVLASRYRQIDRVIACDL